MIIYDLGSLLRAAPSGLYRLQGNSKDPRIGQLCRLMGVCLLRIDAHAARTKRAFLRASARDLMFPSWFGANWDALSDCLTDLSWAPASAYLVLIDCLEAFATARPPDFHRALAIFEDAAGVWSDRGVPFHVLLASSTQSSVLPAVLVP